MRWGAATIVFNGEIYNFVELRRELQSLGWSFDTTGDTEVLLKSLLQWGEGALTRLRGMYAFLLWHNDRQELWAARDRFGIKPRLLGPDAGPWRELRIRDQSRDRARRAPVAPKAVTEFLHFGSPYTVTAFLMAFFELPPGEMTIFKDDGAIGRHPYGSTAPGPA